MSRKLYEKLKGNYVGIFPPPGGWQPGRKGIRRVMCKIDELAHLDEMTRTIRLTELYSRKAREIGDEQHKKEQEKKKKQQRKLWTVTQAKKLWLDSAGATCADNTLKTYSRSVELYIKACGNHPMEEYEESQYNKYLKYLNTEAQYRGRDLSEASVHRHARQLRNFLLFCKDKQIIGHMERMKMPPLVKKDMKTLDIKDLHKIKRYLITQHSLAEMEGDSLKQRDMKNMLRAFMMATQIVARLGAIWSLQLQNIDLKSRMIYIRDNKDLKWKNKCRKWPDKPMNDELYQFLKKDLENRKPGERYYLDKGNGEPWYYDRSEISSFGTEIFQALGLPSIKPFHWGMRATMITELLLSGEDPYSVQHLADHDSIKTTMLYLNRRKIVQKHAVDGIARLMQQEPV